MALAAIPIGYTVGVKISGHATHDAPPFLGQVTQNGLFAGLSGLATTAPIILPLVVAIVAGDSIAGEADYGTLRYLLTAPIDRKRLLLVKLASVFAFCLLASLLVLASGLVIGVATFHVGPMPTVTGTAAPAPWQHLAGPPISLPAALGMLVASAVICGIQLFGYGAIGVFASTLTRIPLGAIIATAAILGAADAVKTASFLTFLRPVLFVTYWDRFADLFDARLSPSGALQAIAGSLGYVAIFSAAAWLNFRRADVTS